MPDMDGYTVCQHLKADERTRKVPVIFISASDQPMDKVKAFSIGGVDYINKPFNTEEVLARIATHITLHRLQTQLQESNEALEQKVAERTTELMQLNRVYERFFPQEFLHFLNKDSILDVNLGDQIQQEMTIVFSDIRSFTSLSENMTPQENFNFINDYLSYMAPIIRRHHGVIDKYIGDAILALFPRHPEDALQAAIAMREQLNLFNQKRIEKGEQSIIKIGLGIHTGLVMLGVIGEKERMQGTVISDTVNLAARLEEITKTYNVTTIVSEQTLNTIADKTPYYIRMIGKIRVRGKNKVTTVFELFNGDSEEALKAKIETIPLFEEGLQLYQLKNFTQASVKFNQILEKNHADKAARFYLERSAHFMVCKVPEEWDGSNTF